MTKIQNRGSQILKESAYIYDRNVNKFVVLFFICPSSCYWLWRVNKKPKQLEATKLKPTVDAISTSCKTAISAKLPWQHWVRQEPIILNPSNAFLVISDHITASTLYECCTRFMQSFFAIIFHDKRGRTPSSNLHIACDRIPRTNDV